MISSFCVCMCFLYFNLHQQPKKQTVQVPSKQEKMHGRRTSINYPGHTMVLLSLLFFSSLTTAFQDENIRLVFLAFLTTMWRKYSQRNMDGPWNNKRLAQKHQFFSVIYKEQQQQKFLQNHKRLKTPRCDVENKTSHHKIVSQHCWCIPITISKEEIWGQSPAFFVTSVRRGAFKSWEFQAVTIANPGPNKTKHFFPSSTLFSEENPSFSVGNSTQCPQWSMCPQHGKLDVL